MAKKKINPDLKITEQDTQEIKDTGFKKFSVNTLDPIIKGITDEVELYLNKGESTELKFKAKKYLTTKTIVQFANEVISACVLKGKYFPSLFDFAFKSTFIEIATDIKLPASIDKGNAFIYGSGIFDVLESVSEIYYLLIRLRSSCQSHIEVIQKQVDNDNICESIIALGNKESKIDELMDSIISFINTMESKFKGLNIEELTEKVPQLTNAIANANEHKLAEAVLDIQKNKSKVVDFPVNEQLEGQLNFDGSEE